MCVWMMAAPAAMHASASAAISSGVVGTRGLRDFGVAPLSAASITTGVGAAIAAQSNP